ncbi:glycosyltransferase family 2 protein [Niastella koreensis]|uniref:glycosyltransferase family 2 protein n=1 Tax=Niastella koreensis TaxID=354356 RepID=UPI0002EF3934|nr:glycosyltransferase [Niastella koreensis]
MKPSLSVVIATWQRTTLLERCLNALLNQTIETSYEIIIVTDGPDRETIKFMKRWLNSYLGRVTVTCLSLPVKKGPAAARNAGWRKSRGELIVFTDDDCVPQPACLAQYWLAYTPYRNTPVAFSGCVQVPLSGMPTDYEMNISQLERASFVTANCACSRQALLLTNGLDEEFTMAWREDTALEFDLSEKDVPIIKVPGAIIQHPVRTATWGVSIREQKKSMFNALLYKKHTTLYDKVKIGRTPRHYYLIACMLLLAFVFAFRNVQLTWLCLAIWAVLTGWFAFKRLRNTSPQF